MLGCVAFQASLERREVLRELRVLAEKHGFLLCIDHTPTAEVCLMLTLSLQPRCLGLVCEALLHAAFASLVDVSKPIRRMSFSLVLFLLKRFFHCRHFLFCGANGCWWVSFVLAAHGLPIHRWAALIYPLNDVARTPTRRAARFPRRWQHLAFPQT